MSSVASWRLAERGRLRIERLAFLLLRYGLVLVLVWIGAMKATDYEATNIERLIAHSPLLSWGYRIWTVRQFSLIIGAAELVIAILITLRRLSPKALCDWQCRRGANVLNNTHVLTVNSRLGAHTRWLSCTLAWGRRISDKGCCSARSSVMVTRGVLGFYG